MGVPEKRHHERSASLTTLPLLAVFSLLYALLAILIRRWPRTQTDLHVTRALQSTHHPNLERFMTFISWFGFRPQSLFLPLGTILAFWLRGRRLEATLLVSAWGSSMASFLTKQVVRRPRPDSNVVRVVIAKTRDSSFPSGHVVHYVTFWGMVTYLLAVRSQVSFIRWFAALMILPVILLVGPSRIYLGHHWFTDVLGSYLLGSAYLAGLIEVHCLLRRNDSSEDPGHDWVSGATQWLR